MDATLIAYYRSKDEVLMKLIRTIQGQVRLALGPDFDSRNPDQVHATIIGLETFTGCAGECMDRLADLRGYFAKAFSGDMTIQFGGFAPGAHPGFSRGRSPYERTFTVAGADIMVLGWPVNDGEPSKTLDALRRECGRLGFRHKYFERAEDTDPDCYMSLGTIRAEAASDPHQLERCAGEVRKFLSRQQVQVPLRYRDICLAWYGNRGLPKATTRTYLLDNLTSFRDDYIRAGK